MTQKVHVDTRSMPEIEQDAYLRTLEDLFCTARLFLSKNSTIGALRRAVRNVEGVTPRCAYCDSYPAFPVRWTTDGEPEQTVYLCPGCDGKETKAIEEEL